MLASIRALHERVRDAVIDAGNLRSLDQMSAVADDSDPGDTIYAVDRVSEDLLVEIFEKEIASRTSLVLIAEGIHGGSLTLPRGTNESDAQWRIIVDPIDGTRGLMYQKRSAWILTGVARNRGSGTNLRDIELAVQTEIPLIKQRLSDVIWAMRGLGAHATRFNRLTGETSELTLQPSQAKTIRHGFAMIARFFPGAREELAAIDEEIVFGALGEVEPGKAHCFEDQYLSSGGQLYELMAGHDRFVADLRPLMQPIMERNGKALGICCHPYDMCTELIARELGVVVTDAFGELLSSPLNIEEDVAWAGYANKDIQDEIEPFLREALRRRGLLNQ